MRTHVTNTARACFAALRQIRSVRWSLPQHALLTLIRTLTITHLDQCNSVLVCTVPVPLYTCKTDCSPFWMPTLGLSTRAGRQNTQLHCYESFTGCASQSESSSGCVFWRTIVCSARHSTGVPVWHQRSSLVAVSALMTPPSTTLQVPLTRPRVFGGCSAGVEQSATRDSGLFPTCDISVEDQVSPFRQSYGWLGAVYSDRQQTSASAVQRFLIKLCKVPMQLCCCCSCLLLLLLFYKIYRTENRTHRQWDGQRTGRTRWKHINIMPR